MAHSLIDEKDLHAVKLETCPQAFTKRLLRISN